MADYEEDFGWDGGWTNAIDHGHGLAELMLGNVHPYDRDDGYIPDPSFATRPEVWKGDQYADGPDNSTDPGGVPGSLRGGGRPLRNRPQGETEEVGSARNGTSSDRSRVGTRGPRPAAEAPTRIEGRTQSIDPRSLGLSAVDVQRVRRIEQDAGARQPRATTAARRIAVAKALGISVEELRLLRRALAGDTYVDAAGVARVVLGKGKRSAPQPSSSPPRLKPQRAGVETRRSRRRRRPGHRVPLGSQDNDKLRAGRQVGEADTRRSLSRPSPSATAASSQSDQMADAAVLDEPQRWPSLRCRRSKSGWWAHQSGR